MTAPCARLIVEPIDGPADLDAAIRAVLAAADPAVLDSSALHAQYGRYCILACEPAETFTCLAGAATDPFDAMRRAVSETPPIPATQRLSTEVQRAGWASRGSSELSPHAKIRTISSTGPRADEVPFIGGWIGFLSYEAGRWIERLPAHTGYHRFLPVASFSLYDTAAVYDRLCDKWTMVGVEWPSGRRLAQRPPVNERFHNLQVVLHQRITPENPESSQGAVRPRWDFSRGEYERIVQRAIDYIAAGDVFQVNLAQRLVVPLSHHPAEVFLRLRQHNPSYFGAYLALPGATVVSASPELFLSLRGRSVVTRPIKGTRRRSADPVQDACLRQALWESPKDRAELAMIIDLERNDLGRVCEYGSVRVVDAASPEQHPTVHHLVGTVAGRLREGLDAIDLLRATFPGGSITGAPKIRAMEIIDELERVPRGVYCGAIGYLGLDGSAMFNIAIRTIAIGLGEAEVYAGGGIVADSIPRDEYNETLAKAAALLDALNAPLDDQAAVVHAIGDEYKAV